MKLGIKVTDKVTGFTGVVTGFVEYLSGCNQALVQPTVDKEGKLMESHWFDVQRLEQVGQNIVTLDNGPTPGADREAPKR